MEIFGVRILGLSGESGRKLLLSLLIVGVAFLVRALLHVATGLRHTKASRRLVWLRKGVRLVVGASATVLIASVWFDDPRNLAVFSGLVAGGLAFASQNLLLSVAGYFVIVLGKTFDLGERVEMGGVRGDVLDIGLFRTTIMEMGVPSIMLPNPNHWVSGRQYTGRVVTVVNAEVFKQPVYNYTRSFSFIWEELRIPVRYSANLALAEQILLEATRQATGELVEEARRELQSLSSEYVVHSSELEPRVYLRLTTSWVELTVRFVVHDHGTRAVRDRIARQVLAEFARHGLSIANDTVEVVRHAQEKPEHPNEIDVEGGAAQAERDEHSIAH